MKAVSFIVCTEVGFILELVKYLTNSKEYITFAAQVNGFFVVISGK